MAPKISAKSGHDVMGEGVTIGEFFIFFLVCLFAGKEQTQDEKSQRDDNDLAVDAPGGDIICDDEIGSDQRKQKYRVKAISILPPVEFNSGTCFARVSIPLNFIFASCDSIVFCFDNVKRDVRFHSRQLEYPNLPR